MHDVRSKGTERVVGEVTSTIVYRGITEELCERRTRDKRTRRVKWNSVIIIHNKYNKNNIR